MAWPPANVPRRLLEEPKFILLSKKLKRHPHGQLCIVGRYRTHHKGHEHNNRVVTKQVVALHELPGGKFVLQTRGQHNWLLNEPPC